MDTEINTILGGKVKIHGKEVKINKPIDAMKNKIAYLPEDRKVDGIKLGLQELLTSRFG